MIYSKYLWLQVNKDIDSAKESLFFINTGGTMTDKQNDISKRFAFLNDTKNKKDVKSSPVFYTPTMECIVEDIVKKLNEISSIFRVSAYKMDYVMNADREDEILDIRYKSKIITSKNKSMNIDKTIFHKLTLCLTVDENRMISDSELERNELKAANAKFIHELSDNDWIKVGSIGTYVPQINRQHSCVVVNLRLPEIQDSFIEMKGKIYYLTYSKIKKISFYEASKVHVNRFASNKKMSQTKQNILRPYYFISVDDNDVINVEFDRKKFNLFEILNHFDISPKPLSKFMSDHRLKTTLKTYRMMEARKIITKAEFDKNLIFDGVLTLLGYREETPFKYYRYGSIIDSLAVEIVSNIIMCLPKPTGKVGERYYHASAADIQKSAESIQKTFKPNLFMTVLAQGDHDSIKSTYSEHCVFNPLKVANDPSQVESILLEEDLEYTDIFGTSQTKTNILRSKGVPAFISPSFLG